MTTLEEKSVRCDRHGASRPPTFACVHVATESGAGFCIPPDADEPWPDALCDVCAAEQPEWTHEIAVERLRLLCKYCWEDCFARNTHVPTHDDANGWLDDARHRAAKKQERWLSAFDIHGHRHWQMELGEEIAWLGFGESATRIHVTCDALVIGSWSARSRSWLWGWANDYWESRLTRPFVALKRFGEAHGLEPLWRASSTAEEDEAFALAAAALDRIGSIEGIYRAPSDEASLFLAVMRTRKVS